MFAGTWPRDMLDPDQSSHSLPSFVTYRGDQKGGARDRLYNIPLSACFQLYVEECSVLLVDAKECVVEVVKLGKRQKNSKHPDAASVVFNYDSLHGIKQAIVPHQVKKMGHVDIFDI